MIRLLFSLFILLYTLPALGAPKVSVDFNERSNTMYFTFHAKDQQISKQAVHFKADLRDRLTFTIKGYKATRAWQNSWKSNFIKRSLLYPSKERVQSYLKVRMKNKIPKTVLNAITIVQKGNKVEVAIPFGMTLKASNKKSVNKPKIEKKEEVDADVGVADADVDDANVDDADVDDADADDADVDDADVDDADVDDADVDDADVDDAGVDGADVEAEEKTEHVQKSIYDESKSCKGYNPPDKHAPNPHEINVIYEELVLTHLNVLEDSVKYPRLLALPVHLIDEKDRENLKYIPELSTHLLDGQMHNRTEVIWIDDQHIRNHSTQLSNDGQGLNIDQALSLAALGSANYIVQTGVCVIPHRANLLGLHSELRNAKDGTLIHTSNYFIKADTMNNALESTIIRQTRSGALWRSTLFPGWGHIYRGDQKGWSYMTAGAVLAAAAITSSVLGYQANQDYLDNDPSTAGRRSDANAHYDRANYLWIGFAALWSVVMVENYVDAKDQVYFKDPYLTLSTHKESP